MQHLIVWATEFAVIKVRTMARASRSETVLCFPVTSESSRWNLPGHRPHSLPCLCISGKCFSSLGSHVFVYANEESRLMLKNANHILSFRKLLYNNESLQWIRLLNKARHNAILDPRDAKMLTSWKETFGTRGKHQPKNCGYFHSQITRTRTGFRYWIWTLNTEIQF